MRSKLVVAAAFGLGLVLGQAPTAFEVVSIRPHVDTPPPGNGKGGGRGMRTSYSGPRATFSGATLGSLVVFAYDLKPYETSDKGWPNWSAEQFDIVAQAPGKDGLSREQFGPLFQALLADRFKLKFHRETKEVSGYMLTVGKNGPKLKAADPDATAFMSLTSPTGTDCAEMKVVSWSMDRLASYFSAILSEPVLEGTGLAGSYDYKLTWSDQSAGCPALVTALQEQIGLKLESRKVTIQILMVDSAEKPALD
jgi:uncharacterized protein (TIGR03435 family)